jgi:hypothetical protein
MLRKVDGGVEVTVWVVPGASSAGIAGRHGDALKVRVTPPPEGGRATDAVVELLASATGRPASLLSGAGSRRKRVLLAGGDLEEVRQRLGAG